MRTRKEIEKDINPYSSNNQAVLIELLFDIRELLEKDKAVAELTEDNALLTEEIERLREDLEIAKIAPDFKTIK